MNWWACNKARRFKQVHDDANWSGWEGWEGWSNADGLVSVVSDIVLSSTFSI